MFSKFFIDRPRFAMVIAIVLAITGIIAGVNMPVTQYPEVTPPQVRVFASYPGAGADTLSQTVGAPLEEIINGVDGMIYMRSSSTSDGDYMLTVTFEIGTNPDMALIRVQNRVQQATPLLPTEVTARGIHVISSFSDTLGFLGLISPNGRRDDLYLSDYAYNYIKDTLDRVPGMGDVRVFGAKQSIRVWLDPDRIASMGLSATEVAAAIRDQNRQASIGSVGANPGNEHNVLTYNLSTQGRLKTARDFEEIIVRTSPAGGVIKLKDIARVELGAEQYNFSAGFNGMPAAVMSLSQSSGSNALDVMGRAKEVIARLEKSLPEGTEFELGYDSTDYVKATIREIIITLCLTFSLVVLVCYVFLQDWKVTLVPVMAIPISLLATFIGLKVLNYTINILSLFGLVLVIGTVVDDAIIVVERMLFVKERDNLSAREATIKAMDEVTGPMTATTLVFLAIFVPVAFMGGITGQIYRQFAVTIAFAVVFSLIVALTLSPAMCAHLLGDVKPKTRGPLAAFNKVLDKTTRGYVSSSMWIAKRKIVTVLIFLAVVGASFFIYKISPTAFIPDEDQGALFMTIELPEGASMARTKAVASTLIPQVRAIPGVEFVMDIEGFSITGSSGENVGSLVISLAPWDERKTPETSLPAIVNKVRKIGASVIDAEVNVFTPPAIMGLGVTGGLDMRLQSTMVDNPTLLAKVLRDVLIQINTAPEVLYAFSSYKANTPNIYLDIDREKAQMLGVPVSTIFSTLQSYFGTVYINDINIGTQVNRVLLQSDASFRGNVRNISEIFVKSAYGNQVPLDALVTFEKRVGPSSVMRYDLYPSAPITIVMKPGYSTGQGIARVAKIAETMPQGFTYTWSGMTYQEQQASGKVTALIAIAMLFGFLFLVAQYESWVIPIPVICSLPVAILGALLGTRIMGLPVSVYSQLGILLLIGLAAKNAILIIEFASEQREIHGQSIMQAAANAVSERFRAVMMTALTCVCGLAPMLFATGAGAASRRAVGSSMFFGMSAATLLGIFIVPGLYVIFQTLREKTSEIFGRKTKGEPEIETEVR